VPVDDRDHRLIEDLYKAMQAGAAGEEALLGLFADDAVLVESFTGRPRTHAGKPAIRAFLQGTFQARAPDLTVTLDRIDVDGDRLAAEWTCTSPAMPGPMRGRDLLTVQDGRIARLEILVTERPHPAP
jgi:uncharacterized protein (TIGR02246 family)